MSGGHRVSIYTWLALALTLWAAYGVLRVLAAPADDAAAAPTTQPQATTSAPAQPTIATAPAPAAMTPPTTRPVTKPVIWPADDEDLGPDVVILDTLSELYEPVPFDHKSHALMANMSTGCVTCHHHQPDPTTRPAQVDAGALLMDFKQAQAGDLVVSDCKSCHLIHLEEVDIDMPGLKGAYHRQCLNCHKEWTHANACGACHQPLGEHPDEDALAARSTPDDVLGRMHPPLPEPDTVVYRMRYTPVDGGNVLFRHKEHIESYGLRCTSCHVKDSCANCHDGSNGEDRPHSRPVRPAMTWAESHGPCLDCHTEDRCQKCHYHDGSEPPPAFSHERLPQRLDADHAGLACRDCHITVKSIDATVTCGDSSCHENKAMTFPADRPGAFVEPPVEASKLPTTRRTARVRPG